MSSKETNPVLKAYQDSGVIDEPYNWHVWKTAWRASEQNTKQQLKDKAVLDPSNCIPSLFKKNFIHAALFGWIAGQKYMAAQLGLDSAVRKSVTSFKSYFGLPDSELTSASGHQSYTRMQREFFKIKFD